MFEFRNLLKGLAEKLGLRMKSAVVASTPHARASLKRRKGISAKSAEARFRGAMPSWFWNKRLPRAHGVGSYDHTSPQREINSHRSAHGPTWREFCRSYK